jgi:transposase
MKKETATPSKFKYSQAFKVQVVREYERGYHTKDDLMNKYKISGHSTVLQWCRKYGKLYYSKTTVPGRPMKDPQKQRIKELEHELKESREKLLVYEKLIEITRRETGIDIIKNIDTKLSSNWQPKQKP